MKRLPISETLLIVGVLTVVILMPLLWKEPQKEIVDAQLEMGRIIQVNPIEATVVAEKMTCEQQCEYLQISLKPISPKSMNTG